jgi:hypothetical protein
VTSIPESSSEAPTAKSTSRASQTAEYYSTTFTYFYVLWTRVASPQTTVESSTTTKTTTLSVLASNRAAALPQLSSMASDIEERASSSAADASPVETGGTTVRETATESTRAGSGASGLRSNCIFWIMASVLMIVALY